MDQRDDNSRAAIRCTALLVGVVVVGTFGFWLIEKQWSLWKSFYFTLITITTVGYGDEGISEAGRCFAAVLLVCGIGTFTYSLSTLVQLAVDRQAARRRRMNRLIKACTDHIIVCGYGRMGSTVCRQLAEGDLQAVVIEHDQQNYQRAVDDGYLALCGIASCDEILLAAGVDRARGVVCAVDSDAENMFITVSVRDLNRNCAVISRAESESAARKLERAGASLVISPLQMAGRNIADALLHPHLAEFMQRCQHGHGLQLAAAEVMEQSTLAGKSVGHFTDLLDSAVLVAIERSDQQPILRPPSGEAFQPGDIVIFAGLTRDVRTMHEACGTVSA